MLDTFGRGERVMGRIRKRLNSRFQNPFRNYKPTHRDVFVATYPKSGTNWMLQMAHQLLWHGQGEFDHIHSVIPWPDEVYFPFLAGASIPLDDDSVWQASPQQRRVIQTHLPWDSLPYAEDARYVSVIRDPKDVFVSNYHFIRHTMGPAMPSVDTWFRLFLNGNFLGGPWPEHTASFWTQRTRPNVCVFSFKAMKRDLRGSVCQLANFLGLRLSDAIIRDVCERSSFAHMKSIDAKFRTLKVVPWAHDGEMIREGKQGASSDLLSRQQQREIDAHFQAELKRLGSDFPYQEFCDEAA
jgi:hypothetical protein